MKQNESEAQKESRVIKSKRSLRITPYFIFALIALNILQGIAIVMRSNQEIEMPPVYAADSRGSVTKLVALPENTQEALALTNFAATAVTYCLSMNFANYDYILANCKEQYFSQIGFNMFDRALNETQILSAVRAGRGITQAVLDGMPTLSEPGKLGQQLVYTIEVPILFERRQVNQSNRPVKQVAIVIVARDNQPNTFDRFRVVQFFVEPRP